MIGDAIRIRRHELGLRLVDVAGRCHVSAQRLSVIETSPCSIRYNTLRSIAAALDTTASELCAMDEAMEECKAGRRPHNG